MCLYTNGCSIRNKEELEVCIQLQSYDLIGVTGTWWDSSHICSAAMDGYRFSWKEKPAR